MVRIIGVGTAVPHHILRQEQARDLAARYFKRFLPHMDRLTSVFEHAQIDERYFVVPIESWVSTTHSMKERNDMYLREATILGQRAIEEALAAAGLTAQDVDNLLVVSSSGIATPSLDARLI